MGSRPPVTLFLDRAATPISETVLREWADALDTALAVSVSHRYGIQVEIEDELGNPLAAKEGGSNKVIRLN